MILSIDQSTSGTKMMLFGAQGELLMRKDAKHEQLVNEKGWVEHNLDEIYANVLMLLREMASETVFAPRALGISNQRETVAAWDRVTGEALYNAIVWQCPRGKAICERVEKEGHAEQVRMETGLPLSPYFSASKFAWLLEEVPAVAQAAQRGTLCLGNIDAWLLFRLTKGKSFKTDASNASRTQLFSINTLEWSKDICDLFGVAVKSLPEVCDSNTLFGQTDFDGVLPYKLPIHAMLGDSHAALFGQGCHQRGTGKITLGTGSSVMLNTGNECMISRSGLATSLAWKLDGQAQYVLEGNINYAGATIDWLVNTLHLVPSPKDVQAVAQTADPADTTYLVPAFTGLGAPYWDSNARAAIVGMGRNTGVAELLNAGLESIAYQIYDIVSAIEKDIGQIQVLQADGGPARNTLLMQFLCDLLQTSVNVPALEELSGAGAAYMAGLAIGQYNKGDLFFAREQTCYLPRMQRKIREQKLAGWDAALRQICKLTCFN